MNIKVGKSCGFTVSTELDPLGICACGQGLKSLSQSHMVLSWLCY